MRFGELETSNETRGLLSNLAKNLSSVVNKLSEGESISKESAARVEFFKNIRQNLDREHQSVLERKATIEKKKEESERKAQEKLRAEALKKQEEEAARKKEEAAR